MHMGLVDVQVETSRSSPNAMVNAPNSDDVAEKAKSQKSPGYRLRTRKAGEKSCREREK